MAMTKQHKEALAIGRAQGRAVRAYLAALQSQAKRGPKLTADKLKNRIETTQQAIDSEPDPARRVELIQQRLNDEERLAAGTDEVDIDALEGEFVEAVGPYSERKGISYSAWREVGVPAAVLSRAGIARTRRTA